jgi:hypothetical protein
MGFDIYGRQPSTKRGQYFGTNWSGWIALADYILKIAPDLAAQCTHLKSNDGDGLGAEQAVALADRLEIEIKEGRCERYAREEAPPAELCPLCEGTGMKKPWPFIGAGDMITGIPCLCGGGMIWDFDVETVQAFVSFLRSCGGFEIW